MSVTVSYLAFVVFQAERAVSPASGEVTWVVVDTSFQIHVESTAFLALLRGADRSPNTIRVYAGRMALFLSWCLEHGVDWQSIWLRSMARFKHWMEVTPISAAQGAEKLRAPGTINAVITAVCEFLRFAAREGLIDPQVAERLTERRYLTVLPRGYNVGEGGQYRIVRARVIKAAEVEKPPEWLAAEPALWCSCPGVLRSSEAVG